MLKFGALISIFIAVRESVEIEPRLLQVPGVTDITPFGGVIKQYTAHGNLTMHGTTRAVTFTLSAERKGGQIEVSGDIPVVFADYNIENPSYAGLVTTQNHGLLEFLLVFDKA